MILRAFFIENNNSMLFYFLFRDVVGGEAIERTQYTRSDIARNRPEFRFWEGENFGFESLSVSTF